MSCSRKNFAYINIFFILVITIINLAHSIEPGTEHNNSTYNSGSQFSVRIYDLLYSAIEMDSSLEVKTFIEFGADVNYRYANGKTPLMIASSIGSINTVKLLLELGADPQLKSNTDMTALDYANKTDEVLVIKTLKTSIISNQSLSAPTLKQTNDIIIAEDIPITN